MIAVLGQVERKFVYGKDLAKRRAMNHPDVIDVHQVFRDKLPVTAQLKGVFVRDTRLFGA